MVVFVSRVDTGAVEFVAGVDTGAVVLVLGAGTLSDPNRRVG